MTLEELNNIPSGTWLEYKHNGILPQHFLLWWKMNDNMDPLFPIVFSLSEPEKETWINSGEITEETCYTPGRLIENHHWFEELTEADEEGMEIVKEIIDENQIKINLDKLIIESPSHLKYGKLGENYINKFQFT